MKSFIKRQLGFTIIELMVALTIAAVMMFFALPAFNDFTNQRRMTANINLLISAITYARSEASRRGLDVTLQRLGGDNDSEWGAGFCVVEGNPGNCTNALRVFQLEGTPTFNAVDSGANSLNAQGGMTFNSRGLLEGNRSGAIELCGVDADDDPGRVVNINALGRASVLQQVCFP